jgi:type II secretory pathway component PulJ
MAVPIYRQGRRKGFSLLELVVFLSIAVIASALAIRLLGKSFSPMQHLTQGTDDQTTLQHAMAGLISDIKEADPSSLPWDKLPASDLSFQKAHYDTVSGSYLTPTVVRYYFILSTGTDTGSLIRSQDDTDRAILAM